MATIVRGITFGATDQVTAAKLHQLVGSATISGILTAEISDLQITDGKIASVSGAKLVTLATTPAGAGALPIANGGTGVATAQLALNALAGAVTANRLLKGNGTNIVLAQADLTTDVTGTLPVGNGGTGATAAANAASGVVVLNASSQLPAVSGALLTGISVWHHSGTVVFNGTTPSSFTDLDLSAVVGANYALVYLRVFAASDTQVVFRTNGEAQTVNYNANGGVTYCHGNNTAAYLIVETDSAGIVEWCANAGVAGYTVTVAGYIK